MRAWRFRKDERERKLFRKLEGKMIMKEDIFKQMLNYPEEYMLQGGGEYQLSSEMSFLRSIVKYKKCEVVIYGAGV